jgi:DNA mismatch endonuclease (patch repair protein)
MAKAACVSLAVTDIYDPVKRSHVMSRVRGSGNHATELRVIEIFRNHGIRGWRRNVPLVGRPDFVFRKQRLAVFIDGCFWHGCSKHGTIPRTNRNFWEEKLTRNKIRDRITNSSLRSNGWRVLRIWQHELQKRNECVVVRRIRSALTRGGTINGTVRAASWR